MLPQNESVGYFDPFQSSPNGMVFTSCRYEQNMFHMTFVKDNLDTE